ncbi:lysozyme-like protein [Amylocystis lapponica]|nr:lysozyme-like protein [Amylocystis lapponica]
MDFTAPFYLLVIAVSLASASSSHFGGSHLERRYRHAHLEQADNTARCSTRTRHNVGPHATCSRSLANIRPKSKHTKNMPSAESSAPKPSGNTRGVIDVQSSCGPTGATPGTTPISGPNGAIEWLNCGVDDGGWRPPYVTVADIVTQNLTIAIQEAGSPFKACRAFLPLFEQYAEQYGVPSILVAAIAMQESSCNPATVGGAGEQGLMQLTWDKCGDAPGGNCRDPDFNVRTGVEYFSTTLKNNGGSLLLTIGNYNGWPAGMTYVRTATAAAQTPCCRCQNNLDYLQQTLNGWLQNVNPYMSSPRIGKYFNLDQCF